MAPWAANLTTWVLDSGLAAVAVLTAGRVLLCLVRRPAARQRVAELTLAACIVAPLLACAPGWPRISLGLIATDTSPVLMIQTVASPSEVLPTDAPTNTNKLNVQQPHSALPALPAQLADHDLKISIPWLNLILPIYIFGMTLAALRWAIGHHSLRRLSRTAHVPDASVQSIWNRCATPNGSGKFFARVYGAMLPLRSSQWKHVCVWPGQRSTGNYVHNPHASDGAPTPSEAWHLAPPAQLLITDRLTRPITFGIFSPLVLIPSTLCCKSARRELVAVLRHEAVHVSRHDARSWAIASLVQILFFYQPLYWWLRRDLRVAQEFIADACAAGNFPSPAAYAQQLLQVLRQTNSHGGLETATGAIGLHSEFFIRMRHLLDPRNHVQPHCSRGFSTVAAVALLAVTVAAAAMTVGGPAPRRLATTTAGSTPTGPHEPERRGIAFLLSQQDQAGAWLPRSGPAMTALVVKALLQSGRGVDDVAVRRGLTFIDHLQQRDHGYYLDSSPAYNTAIVLGTLALLPGDAYRQRIADGRHFLQNLPALNPAPQNNPWYATPTQNAGISLGFMTPDPSDAATWTVEAFHDTGSRADDAIVRAALNRVPPFNPDPTERSASTVLPNYGSLTYAQLKSMLYAGLTRQDPRVQLAIHWIRQNYTLDANPADTGGRGQFFYYHTLAKALSAYGQNPITDSRGIRHDWKVELRDRLATLQNPDGSWLNQKVGDYLENNPVVVTAYGVLALQETRK